MLEVHGSNYHTCDGVSRRSFLKIGAFAFGAYHLSLADVLRAESSAPSMSSAPSTSSHKAVINIFLGGGPPPHRPTAARLRRPA